MFFSTNVWIFFLIMVYMTVYPKIMRKDSSLIIGEYRIAILAKLYSFLIIKPLPLACTKTLYIRLLIIRNSCRTLYTKALRQNLVDGQSTQISRRNTVLQLNQKTIPCNNSYIIIHTRIKFYFQHRNSDENNLNDCNKYFT